MALPLAIKHPEPETIRRKIEVAKRLPVELPGRVMLSDRFEMPCMAISISNLEVEIVAPRQGKIGERIVCYIEHIQRIEAEIVEIAETSFVARISNGARGSRDKTAARIRWALEKDRLGENRRSERIEPVRKAIELKIGDLHHKGRLIDVSISGAAIATTERPRVDAFVTVGHTRARVVRHLPDGIAVEFVMPLPVGSFDENVVL